MTSTSTKMQSNEPKKLMPIFPFIWIGIASLLLVGLFVELLGSSLDSSGAPGIEGGRLFSILELGGESLDSWAAKGEDHGKLVCFRMFS